MSNKNLVRLDTAPELQGIEESKAEKIQKTFEPMVEWLKGFEDEFNGVMKMAEKEMTEEVAAKAKRVRLDISKVRIETGKLKDKEKAEYLRASKAIQGVHNILVWAVEEKEQKLREVEDYYRIQEQKRIERLQSERVEKLSKYVQDAEERDLGTMDEDVWKAYFDAKKKEWKDRRDAEKKAEQERKERERKAKLKADRETKLRPYWDVLDENEAGIVEEMTQKEFDGLLADLEQKKEDIRKRNQLKAQREEEIRPFWPFVEKKLDDLSMYSEEDWKACIEVLKSRKKKADEEEAKKQAARKAARKAAEKKAEEERKERQAAEERAAKLEAEAKQREEDERKRQEEEEAKRQAELGKTDKAKVNRLIGELEELKTKYSFRSKRNQAMYSQVGDLLTKVVNHINENING